jgi:hypothetical protein
LSVIHYDVLKLGNGILDSLQLRTEPFRVYITGSDQIAGTVQHALKETLDLLEMCPYLLSASHRRSFW